MSVRIPTVVNHPNRKAFEGVLTYLDRVSDRSPHGANGHCIILPRRVAERAIPSLLGMCIDYRPSWDGHDARRKIGLITDADISGSQLVVKGYLYAKDFPEIANAIRAKPNHVMGMSFEVADVGVEDKSRQVWRLNNVVFTGAAVLRKDKAAYKATSFRLASRNWL